MKIRSLAIGALALMLPLAVVACGGKDDTNSGKRPSVQEISTALRDEVPAEAEGIDEPLDCMAEKLHESKLPNGVLRALVDGREAEIDKDNEAEYNEILTSALGECMDFSIDDLDIPDDIEIPEND